MMRVQLVQAPALSSRIEVAWQAEPRGRPELSEGAEMDFLNPPDNEIRAILSNPVNVAVVGCAA
jgi:hypothetical protein